MPETAQTGRPLSLVDDLLAPEDAWGRAREGKEGNGGSSTAAGGGGGEGARGESGSPAVKGDTGSTPPKAPEKRKRSRMDGSTNILIGGLLILLGGFLAWADLSSGPARGALRPLALVAALLLVSHGVLMLITATEEKKDDSGARERSGMLMLALGLVLALATLGHDPQAQLTLSSYLAAFVLFGTGYILLVRRPVAR